MASTTNNINIVPSKICYKPVVMLESTRSSMASLTFTSMLSRKEPSGNASVISVLWQDILWSWGLKKCTTQLFLDSIDNSIISHLNLRGISASLVWMIKHYDDDDYGGNLNTVRFTGKPANTEGKRNPGIEQSHFSSVYILWISNRRTSVSYQIGGSTLLEKQNKTLAFSQCGKTTVCIMLSS